MGFGADSKIFEHVFGAVFGRCHCLFIKAGPTDQKILKEKTEPGLGWGKKVFF